MDDIDYYWSQRTLCDVLDEMRKCDETKNYAPIRSLIEEAQIMGNRMESSLGEKKHLRDLHDKIKEARKELKCLKEKEKDSQSKSDAS